MSDNPSMHFAYGNVNNEPDTIYIKISGSGIDCDNAKHESVVRMIAEAIGPPLYATAHDLSMDNVIMQNTTTKTTKTTNDGY